jgi:hypothetical protein
MGNHLLLVNGFWTDRSLLEFEIWLIVFGSEFYSEKSNGRSGGAIIIGAIECVQMTVGGRLHTTGMRTGDDHDDDGELIRRKFYDSIRYSLGLT